eukprot:4188457-Pleurochrysis_carterae.AAC.1
MSREGGAVPLRAPQMGSAPRPAGLLSPLPATPAPSPGESGPATSRARASFAAPRSAGACPPASAASSACALRASAWPRVDTAGTVPALPALRQTRWGEGSPVAPPDRSR